MAKSLVFKLGRTTGCTVGEHHDLTTVFRTTDTSTPGPEGGIITHETTVLSKSAPFADKGDSGALVFNADGTKLGIIWAGGRVVEDFTTNTGLGWPPPPSLNRLVFVTPLEAVRAGLEDLVIQGVSGDATVHIPDN